MSNELEEHYLYQEEIAKFRNSYIFVNTNFKRTTQPIFTLAIFESQRLIKIREEKFICKSEAEN